MTKTYEVKEVKPSKMQKAFGYAVGFGGAMLATANAHAVDVASALSGSTAKSDIETGIVWALGIAVVIYAGRKVIGFFSR